MGVVAACTRVIVDTVATIQWTGLTLTVPQDVFLGVLVRSMLGHGVGYVVNVGGTLHAVPKSRVSKVLTAGAYVFTVTDATGTAYQFSPPDIIEIFNATEDGVTPLSPIASATSSFNVASASEKLAESYPANASTPGLAITYANTLSPASRKALREGLDAIHAGAVNAGKTLILDSGGTMSPIPVANLRDAQLIESRKFSAEQIASIYGVPLHLINLSAPSGDVETQNANFIRFTIRPLVEKIERALGVCGVVVDGDLESLERGNTQSRYAAYSIAAQFGFMSINEIRAAEGLPPSPDPAGNRIGLPANIAGQVTGTPVGGTNVANMVSPPKGDENGNP